MPEWVSKTGPLFLPFDFVHRFPLHEVIRASPLWQCHWWSRMINLAIEMNMISQFKTMILCYQYNDAKGCRNNLEASDYLAKEVITSVGFGEWNPWTFGSGSMGGCEEPADANTLSSIQHLRNEVAQQVFEHMIYIGAWVGNAL